MNSLQGYLLIASPELVDPNFRQTVVLIIRHGREDGALGLVLNRRTSTTLKELAVRLGHLTWKSESPLSLGGPCEGPLMALHAERALGEVEVLPGVFFTTDREQLETLVDREQEARFFFGYAGWAPGQLELELHAGGWRIAPAAPKHVFALDESLWERTTSEAAGWEVLSVLNLKNVPADPTLN